MKLVKYVRGDIAYYICDEHLTQLEEYAYYDGNALRLLQFAQVVIDLSTNKIIKCRYTLEDVFDKLIRAGGVL